MNMYKPAFYRTYGTKWFVAREFPRRVASCPEPWEGRFRGFSAGSNPSGEIAAGRLNVLSRLGFDTSRLRAKSWEEFAVPDAPIMDFIFTVAMMPLARPAQSGRDIR